MSFSATEWIAHSTMPSFSVEAEQTGNRLSSLPGTELDKIFSQQQERVVDNDNTVRLRKPLLADSAANLPLQPGALPRAGLRASGPDHQCSLRPSRAGPL